MTTRRLLPWAVLLLAAAACSGGPDLPTSGPVAVYASSGEGGDAAQLEGRLAERDGCVVVEPGPGAGAAAVPVLPDAATWGDAGLTFAGRTYAEGTTVSMGGGGDGAATTDETTYVPDACAGTRTFVVAQGTASLAPS